MRRGARWNQEKASLFGEKAAIACLIVRDPLFNLCPAELSRRRQFFGSRAQSGSEEQHKLLLLFIWQSIGGGFDFSECAHDWERSITAARISRACFVRMIIDDDDTMTCRAKTRSIEALAQEIQQLGLKFARA